MNLINAIQKSFISHIAQLFNLDDQQARRHAELAINDDDSKKQFGDLNANVAMTLAKELKQNPRAIAQQIADSFTHPHIEKIEIAGPGFLNLFLTSKSFVELAQALHSDGESFFALDSETPKKNFSIEFVSANPTGPLHFGHGRNGIIGDVLGNIVKFIGHKATKEFYINDAGAQIEKLGESLKIRCQQEAGIEIAVPIDEGYYLGDYLIDLAKKCIDEYGIAVIGESGQFFQKYAKEKILQSQKELLNRYGIHFDVWFSEKSLHTSGAIDDVLQILQKNDLLYEKEGALWFKSTEFGDDKDRVLRKSSGELTYAAADVAYLQNKVDRGFDQLVMVLGHDHHSYAVRLQAILQGLGLKSKATLDVILYQLVKIKAGNQQVRMSKRAGNVVTLEDVVDTVGTDIARFFFLNRKADAQLEFDLELAQKKTDENPVYYVQYAYVRTNSILTKASQESELLGIGPADAANLGPDEALLLKKIASLGVLLESISGNYQTHLLTYYVLELANQFHSYYAKHKVIDLDNIPQSRSRLLLVALLRNTIGTALKLLGVSRPEKM